MANNRAAREKAAYDAIRKAERNPGDLSHLTDDQLDYLAFAWSAVPVRPKTPEPKRPLTN